LSKHRFLCKHNLKKGKKADNHFRDAKASVFVEQCRATVKERQTSFINYNFGKLYNIMEHEYIKLKPTFSQEEIMAVAKDALWNGICLLFTNGLTSQYKFPFLEHLHFQFTLKDALEKIVQHL
jgi:hypothetical protein